MFTKTKFHQVFLIPKDYLQNWLVWAYHQPVPKGELRRQQLALRMAAESYKLVVPKLDAKYEDPGPIDSSSLSDPTYPLLLRERVVIWDGQKPKDGESACCAVPERYYEVSLVPFSKRTTTSPNETYDFVFKSTRKIIRK